MWRKENRGKVLR